MDKSNWEDAFNNKMELDTSSGFQGTEPTFDVNEIADDMFRINDDKLIGMVGDDFLTQFGLDEAFNSELFSTDTSYSNQSCTFSSSTSEEDSKIFDSNKINVHEFNVCDLPKKKKIKVQKEIKTEVDNTIAPVLIQGPNAPAHSAIIVPINTLTPNPSVTQAPQINTTVHQGPSTTLVQSASQLVAIQSLPTVMYNYTEANGTIKSQVSLIHLVKNSHINHLFL